ncbi:MAG TPA: M28 family peptidase [Polyangiaceae bacterium]|nr:M28 family peptidase [Polyangiaceae bacterium]
MKHPNTTQWRTVALSGLLIAATAACQATSSPSHAKSTEAVQTHSAPRASSSTASEAITAEYLRTQVSRISADEFEGRSPGTPGDQKARAYLREQLAALGVAPGFGGDHWEQPVELVGLKARLPTAWQFRRGERSVSLAFWEQYIAGSGVQTAAGAIEDAELVFIGYGIEAPEYGWDDFKGQSVKGKVVLVLNNDPDWDPALFAGKTRLYYGRWTYKYENAARHGAVGAIIVHTTPSAGYPYQVVQSSWGGEQFSLPSNGPTSLQLKGWVTEDAARSLVALADQSLERLRTAAQSRDFKPVPLGIKTSLRFENQVARVQTANVVGRIDGSDPHLRDEYVVLSAHHDHLGIGKPDATGDAIYNGALDNGAGVAQVLGIVKALQALPTRPRRSILVLFPGAEEAGLLGSQYFTEHPPIAAGKIAANINFDGGNIWGRARDITQIGKGKSSLDAIVAGVAARLHRTVQGDQFPDKGTFYRSDQFNFAKIGVPALYLKTGTDFIDRAPDWGKQQILAFEAKRYHQPSDQLESDWNFDGMVDDARFGFEAALEIANADRSPEWVPGDEFEAARRAALAAIAH